MPLIVAGRQQQSRLHAQSRGNDEEQESWQSQSNRWVLLSWPSQDRAVQQLIRLSLFALWRHRAGHRLGHEQQSRVQPLGKER